MIEAGVIGVKAGWDDAEARAKASQFVAWAKSQLASIGSAMPAMAGGGGGGFFNRTGGGGQVAGAAGGGGGGGWGGFRPLAFDAEAEQVRGGLRTLARALYGQAMALGQMNLTGGGGGAAALAGGGGSGGGGGNVGQGMANGLMTRLGRAGGIYAAWRGINYIGGAINSEMIEREDVDRLLGRNDQEGAVREQLSEVRGVRGNWVHRLARAGAHAATNWMMRMSMGIPRAIDTDSETNERLEGATDTLRAKGWANEIRQHVTQQRQASQLTLTSGYRSAMLQADFLVTNAAALAQSYNEKADSLGDNGSYLKTEARQIKSAAAFQASAMRAKAREGANTIGMGLGFDIEEQQLRNALMPHTAQAAGIFANTAMHVREMMINSTPQNAELARQLGVAQEQGFKMQMIMAGHGGVGNPFSEAMGPTAGTGRETLTDILRSIDEKMDRLLNTSLGDLSGTGTNPLDF